MSRSMILAATLMCCIGIASAQDSVTWARVEGIISPGASIGTGTGAVPGGGLPWTTTRGAVYVNLTNGQIQFVVRGLVLAAGNSIGTRGDITQVRGTLVCDINGSAGGGNSALVATPAVSLSPTGDAVFSGDVGSLPAVCSSQSDLAFLIRVAQVNGNNVNGPWIAFGAVRRD